MLTEAIFWMFRLHYVGDNENDDDDIDDFDDVAAS